MLGNDHLRLTGTRWSYRVAGLSGAPYELVEAANDKVLAKTIARYRRVDLLLIADGTKPAGALVGGAPDLESRRRPHVLPPSRPVSLTPSTRYRTVHVAITQFCNRRALPTPGAACVRTIGGARSLCCGLAGLAVIAAVASCSTTPGNADTDRIATVVAEAISFPRQDSAAGLVGAALATKAGKTSSLMVIEMEELAAADLVDPFARLVFRVHRKAQGFGISGTDAITACYESRFSYYGVIGSPHRINCPKGATAIVPVPLAPQQRIVIPAGFDATLAKLLAATSPASSAGDVIASVTGGLPAPGVDRNTGLEDLSPTVEAAVSGRDVGVSLREHDRSCLLGARIGGQVTVWRPSRVQMQPGELSCDPHTALQLAGTSQPR